jgi:hypothetical protein
MTPPTRTPPAIDNYRPDIDGLRAFAVLSVVLYHAFPDVVGGGYVGVDIFLSFRVFLSRQYCSQKILKTAFRSPPSMGGAFGASSRRLPCA